MNYLIKSLEFFMSVLLGDMTWEVTEVLEKFTELGKCNMDSFPVGLALLIFIL